MSRSPNPVGVSTSGGDGGKDAAGTIALRHRRRGGVLPRKTLMSKSGVLPDFDTPPPVSASPTSVSGSHTSVSGSHTLVDSSPSGRGGRDAAVSTALRHRRRGGVLPSKTPMLKSLPREPVSGLPDFGNFIYKEKNHA
jgi:hypothetical protein